VIITQNNLAKLLESTGRNAEALALYEETLTHLVAGTDQAAHLRANLGQCLRRMGRVEEALPHLREAHASAVASVGAGALLTRTCALFLADGLLDAGQPAEAETLARAALEAARVDPDSTPAEQAEAGLRLGFALAALERGAEARRELEAALAVPDLNAERTARATELLRTLPSSD
jgi:tetratricopeptide (TPR) repeat protein